MHNQPVSGTVPAPRWHLLDTINLVWRGGGGGSTFVKVKWHKNRHHNRSTFFYTIHPLRTITTLKDHVTSVIYTAISITLRVVHQHYSAIYKGLITI